MTEKIFNYVLDGLAFTVTVTESGGVYSATISVTEGHADFNALYWGDDVDDGTSAALTAKRDSSLNMNGATYEGETVDWDGAQKLSSAGLGGDGPTKATYLEAGESLTITLAGVTSFDMIDYLGIRATSTSTPEGSIKAIDEGEIVEPPPGEDHFPEWASPAISHVTFYFDTPDGFVFDTNGLPSPPGNGMNTPDGWFTVKFDVAGDAGNEINDLDNWYQDALTFISGVYGDLSAYLAGVAIKGGQSGEVWYDFDNDPADADTPPAGIPDYPILQNELDAAHTVATNILTLPTDDFLFL